MVNESILTVVQQKEVTFYDDQLIAVLAADGNIYVSVRHLCDALGLDRRGQVRRIQRQPILADGYKGGDIMSPPSPSGVGGGPQQAGLLLADLVPLWLAGINTGRVKEEIRAKLERYQREAARVLWEAFQEGRLTSDDDFAALLERDTEVVQAYKMAMAVVKLARNQILIEARLDDYGERLERIETTLGDPGHHVTPDQATQISQAVKTVAMELGKRSKKNEYGAVYGQLYREFAVTSYKQLPAAQFDKAMAWLTDWYRRVTGATGPDEPPW